MPDSILSHCSEKWQKYEFSICHVSTETAADDPSKSAKRTKRGNAGSMYSSKTEVVFLELFSSV